MQTYFWLSLLSTYLCIWRLIVNQAWQISASFLVHVLLNSVCVLYYLWFSFHSRITSFIYLAFLQKKFNPYSRQHQFSPYKILHCQEKWLWEWLKWSGKRKYFDLLSNSLNLFFLETYEDQFGEFVCGYWAFKD